MTKQQKLSTLNRKLEKLRWLWKNEAARDRGILRRQARALEIAIEKLERKK